MQVDLDFGVARIKADVLVEKHRSVTVRIQNQQTLVQFFGFAERAGFADEPSEERHHAFVLIQDETFRMPLYAQHGFVFRAFDGFYHPVGGRS